MTEPIRWGWCDAHNGITMPMSGGEAFCLANQLPANIGNCVNRPAVLVESRDGDGRLLGLLAADQCDHCHGSGIAPYAPTMEATPCGGCGGSGHTLRALTSVDDEGRIYIDADAHLGRVAVLPVEP